MRYVGKLCGSFISTTTTTRQAASYPLVLSINRPLSSSPHAKMANINLGMQLTTQLETKIKLEDERYRMASERSWEINAALIRCDMARDSGDKDALLKEDDTLEKLVRVTVLCSDMYNNIVHENNGGGDTTITTVHPRAPRLGNLGNKMEDYARYKAFQHYLLSEKLLSPSAPCFTTEQDDQRNILTDEEYLGGVCIGLCHDLAKYGVTRASNAVEDTTAVPFIKRARDAVSAILEELLQFDFRNGPLRRKYDSTKYALKTLETVLYELSVAGSVGGHKSLVIGYDKDVPPVKKMKIADEDKLEKANLEEEDVPMGQDDQSEESSAIPKKEIGELRDRMDHRDKLRESLIKTCRDGQKAAKQSIFAMHRGDTKKASKLLNDCENCVKNDLIPILEEEPTLRYGSFSNVLEEWVEGKLFYTWLHGEEGNETSKGMNQAVGKILLPDEFQLKISTEDYLGGLCDLSGEIGRFAVARATVRDKESVKLCLESNKSILMTLKMLGKLPRNISKKVNMVNTSVEKLERVLYEQSLMEMTGRKEFASGVEENAGFDKDAADDN